MARHGGAVPTSYLVRPSWAPPPEPGRHRRPAPSPSAGVLAVAAVLLTAALAASAPGSVLEAPDLPAAVASSGG